MALTIALPKARRICRRPATGAWQHDGADVLKQSSNAWSFD